MALLTFNPPVGPSPGTRKGRDIKILEADFGDGYSQPTPDGYNHIRRTLSLTWEGVTKAQYQQIIAFFEQHEGVKPFYYRFAGDTSALKWICTSWEETAQGIYKITAEFKQSFTLAV